MTPHLCPQVKPVSTHTHTHTQTNTHIHTSARTHAHTHTHIHYMHTNNCGNQLNNKLFSVTISQFLNPKKMIFLPFIAPKMKIRLEPSTQTAPENKATSANFTRTNNSQSLPGTNCDLMVTMNFLIAVFGWGNVTCIVQKHRCLEDC